MELLPIIDCLSPACGACCMRMTLPPMGCVIGTPEEAAEDAWWDSLPEHLQEEINAVPRSVSMEPCIWLDLETRRCKHYEHRPPICRDCEIGGEFCLEEREQEGIGPSYAEATC